MPRTLLLLAAALSAAAVLLAGPEPCRGARPSAAEKKIEEALSMPTQLEFVEAPLQDVVEYLKDFHKIEIQMDKKAFDDEGLDPSTTPITKNLKGLSLRSALSLMLRDLNLTYEVRDEVLLITTPAAAAKRLTTKVYPVADLVASDDEQKQAQQREVLIHVITSTVAPDSWTGGPTSWAGGMGGFGMGGYGPGYSARGYDGPTPGPPRPKPEAGRKGSITGASFGRVPVLVVSQTYHVHYQIAALLEELRRVTCVKQPTPAKEEHKAPAGAAAKPAAEEPTGPPAAKPPKPPAGDPFGAQPAAKPSAEGSASPPDDPFRR
jgi:hypothetical protein